MDALERKLEQSLRDPLLLVFLSLLVLCMAAAVFVFITVLLTDESGINASTFMLAMVASLPFIFLGFFAAIGLFWRFFRKQGADQVVVWLRRFHQHEPYRFPLPEYLSILGASRFQVATIQDSRFSFSFLTGQTRSMLPLALTQIPLTFVYFILAVIITDRIFDWFQPERVPFGIFEILVMLLIMLIISFVLFSPIYYLTIKKRGVVNLKKVGDLARIEKWFNRIHSGIGHIMPGLKIFKCGDDFWMDAVRVMLERCDTAIIDISDLNENMRWELGQCVDLIAKDKLILAYSIPPDRYPDDPADSLVDEIEGLIGEAKMQNVLFWPYPEPLRLMKGKAKIDERMEYQVIETLVTALGITLDGEKYEVDPNQQ